MTPESRQQLKNLLVNQVKYEQFPHTSPAGDLLIGFSRDLVSRGILLAEALQLLDNDISYYHQRFSHLLHFFDEMTEPRQIALIALCIPEGIKWILNFSEFMLELESMNYERAASVLLKSEWADNNPDRASCIANIVRSSTT